MFARILSWFRSTKKPQPAPDAPGIEVLDRQAPLRATLGEDAVAPSAGETYVCRDAVLGKDQRIAGHHFLLRESTRSRIRHNSRLVHHVYAEVLVRSLTSGDVGRLLGHRLAFVDIPDSFADRECLCDLPASNTVLCFTTLPDAGAPDTADLAARLTDLKAKGYAIALPASGLAAELTPHLPLADYLVLEAASLDTASFERLHAGLSTLARKPALIARGIPAMEHFRFCLDNGVTLFQGPFVTSRENWSDNHVAPNTVRLGELVARLRRDAETRELVEHIKHEPALSLRLLRYVNSAAGGLRTPVSSIDAALQMIGRDRLGRWLMLLLCNQAAQGGRGSSALDTALVRARFMELGAAASKGSSPDALFLTGLLSLIDVVLQVPLERALESLSVSTDIAQAVSAGEGPYAPLLALAKACELPGAEGLEELADRCGLTPAQVSQNQFDALMWASEVQA
jgi:EAL and modified HD-GYP domain-containing signal transduction protein